jgi:hypothetical protein
MFKSFINLLSHSWYNLVADLGTTTLSIIVFSIALPVLVFAIQVFGKWRSVGYAMSELGKIIAGAVWPTIIALTVTLSVWFALYLRSIVKTVYGDRVALLGQTAKLEKEKENLASELVQERDRSRPKLFCRFDQWFFTTLSGTPNKTHIFLQMTFGNRGMPSVIQSWQFHITTPDGNIYEGKRTIMNVPFVEPSGVRLYKEDQLFIKDVTQPIPSGALRPGWLCFVVDKPEKELFFPTTVMDLSFEDINESGQHAKQTVQGTGGHRTMYYPGFKLPPEGDSLPKKP